MTNNQNGFADALNQLNTVVNVNTNVTLDVLETVAQYFVKKLKAVVPTGDGAKHLKNELKVKVNRDNVQVIFGANAWYWYLVEHGHKAVNGKKIKGQHFVRNTVDRENKKMAEMMLNKIIERMEG
jgi:HK97 gp10 family phage protein